MYFVCFCSSLKQCAAVELHMSVLLMWVILDGCIAVPGSDL